MENRHSTHTPYSTTHSPQPQDGGNPSSYRKDPMQLVAHKLLEVLRQPGSTVKEKLRDFLGYSILSSCYFFSFSSNLFL